MPSYYEPETATSLRFHMVHASLSASALCRKEQRQKSKVSNIRHPVPSACAEAKACFLKALEIARRQQGKKSEARHLLSDIYNWFTEGFDTKDLQEAKALLEELT